MGSPVQAEVKKPAENVQTANEPIEASLPVRPELQVVSSTIVSESRSAAELLDRLREGADGSPADFEKALEKANAVAESLKAYVNEQVKTLGNSSDELIRAQSAWITARYSTSPEWTDEKRGSVKAVFELAKARHELVGARFDALAKAWNGLHGQFENLKKLHAAAESAETDDGKRDAYRKAAAAWSAALKELAEVKGVDSKLLENVQTLSKDAAGAEGVLDSFERAALAKQIAWMQKELPDADASNLEVISKNADLKLGRKRVGDLMVEATRAVSVLPTKSEFSLAERREQQEAKNKVEELKKKYPDYPWDYVEIEGEKRPVYVGYRPQPSQLPAASKRDLDYYDSQRLLGMYADNDAALAYRNALSSLKDGKTAAASTWHCIGEELRKLGSERERRVSLMKGAPRWDEHNAAQRRIAEQNREFRRLLAEEKTKEAYKVLFDNPEMGFLDNPKVPSAEKTELQPTTRQSCADVSEKLAAVAAKIDPSDDALLASYLRVVHTYLRGRPGGDSLPQELPNGRAAALDHVVSELQKYAGRYVPGAPNKPELSERGALDRAGEALACLSAAYHLSAIRQKRASK